MTKFRIQEGKGDRPGSKYYQVFIGGKTIGPVYSSLEAAEAYVKYLEQKQERSPDSTSPSP